MAAGAQEVSFDPVERRFCAALADAALPAGVEGPRFRPRVDFPPTAPPPEARPWEAIDFTVTPDLFLQSVLDYVLEGMDRDSWNPRRNAVRDWYHAPWMCEQEYGREALHGLTRERTSEPHELGPAQASPLQNWAVSFFNPVGGHALGEIWGDGSIAPQIDAIDFPEGTVIGKALYTEGSAQEVPFLQGAPTLRTLIHADETLDGKAVDAVKVHNTHERTLKHRPAVLNLLQFDLAVRLPINLVEERAGLTGETGMTGWIYGTYIYHSDPGDPEGWEGLRPLGLTWGNEIEQSVLTAGSPMMKDKDGDVREYGYEGRMNGPVDNPRSSCLSCHGNAQFDRIAPEDSIPWPPRSGTKPQIDCYFRNLGPDTPFGPRPGTDGSCKAADPRYVAVGTSLQVAIGLINYCVGLRGAEYEAANGTLDPDGHAALCTPELLTVPQWPDAPGLGLERFSPPLVAAARSGLRRAAPRAETDALQRYLKDKFVPLTRGEHSAR